MTCYSMVDGCHGNMINKFTPECGTRNTERVHCSQIWQNVSGKGKGGERGAGRKGITRDRRVVLNMYSGPDRHFSLHCCYEAGGRGGGGGGNSCYLLYIQQQYPESTTKDALYLRWKHVLTYTQGGVLPMQ